MSRFSYGRRRRLASVALLPIVVFALGAFAATTAVAGDRTPDARLLQTYQPVLVFHPSEPFRPTKVQSFVEDSELERFTGSSPAQLPLDRFWTVVDADPEPGELPPVAPGVFYRLDQVGCQAGSANAGRDCYASAWDEGSGGDAVYGRVVRTETAIVLQYWLFYYDNPYFLLSPFSAFWQSHEGDWELVNVVLDADERPVEAAYSQHCMGQRRDWEAVSKSPVGSTHPVAYVALGSHANYFAPGVYPIASTCVPAEVPAPLLPFIRDQVVNGSSVGAVLGPTGTEVPGATLHKIEGMGWSEFGGRWGESEYFHAEAYLPLLPTAMTVPFGLAPASPANQLNWLPGTVLAWPES